METTESFCSQFMKNPSVQFILSPQTIARMTSWIFSVIVCGSITQGGFQNVPISSELKCVLNENSAACGYGIGLGIVAAILSLLFLLLDISDLYIKTYFLHKVIRIADFACSALCTALWFIGFCFMAHAWALSVPDTYPLGVASGQTAIVFSFFSIPCWVALSYLAFTRLCPTSLGDCKHSTMEAIFPAMRRLSSLSGKVDPLQRSNNAIAMTSAQEMHNTLENVAS
ncbi:synaptogyrin-4 isoform X2 [Dendropsophus ebraccatus]|uniref:synaptogyrin-4 isoform X2 n=1 Tax=Dendropsophus ebraccatus TaxID=150705 RepID=UPI0038315424